MTTKFIITVSVGTLLLLTGCQQAKDEANKLQTNATKTWNDASQQVESTKKQVLDAKAKVDEKMTQAQQAADAVHKLVN